jgi:hypothetical protein
MCLLESKREALFLRQFIIRSNINFKNQTVWKCHSHVMINYMKSKISELNPLLTKLNNLIIFSVKNTVLICHMKIQISAVCIDLLTCRIRTRKVYFQTRKVHLTNYYVSKNFHEYILFYINDIQIKFTLTREKKYIVSILYKI